MSARDSLRRLDGLGRRGVQHDRRDQRGSNVSFDYPRRGERGGESPRVLVWAMGAPGEFAVHRRDMRVKHRAALRMMIVVPVRVDVPPGHLGQRQEQREAHEHSGRTLHGAEECRANMNRRSILASLVVRSVCRSWEPIS